MRLFHSRIPRNGFFLIAFSVLSGWSQGISDTARQQMRDALRIKDSLSEAQRKISSDLLFSGMAARNVNFGAIPSSAVKRL